MTLILKNWSADVPHVGIILDRTLRIRNIKPSELAVKCEVNPSDITRLINENKRRNRSTRYIEYLKSNEVEQSLTEFQAQILADLFVYSDEAVIKEQEEKFSYLNFDFIKTRAGFSQFQPFINQAEKRGYFWLVMDPAWFIHAQNGGLPLLFGCEINNRIENSHFFQDWTSWHSVAMKSKMDELLVTANEFADDFFTRKITNFFQHKPTYQFLFTTPLQRLIVELKNMSNHQYFKFNEAWNFATSFAYPYRNDVFNRVIQYQGFSEPLTLVIKIEIQIINIQLAGNITIPFTMLIWQPLGTEAERAYNQISKSPFCSKILFAADFDDGRFHINTWQEVEDYYGRDLKKAMP